MPTEVTKFEYKATKKALQRLLARKEAAITYVSSRAVELVRELIKELENDYN